jgi:Tol biopolymer transport system component
MWRSVEMRLLGVVLGAALAALTATSCGGGGEEAIAPKASPVPTVTGVAEVDAVIRVVVSGDVEALRQLIQYTQVHCKADPEMAGTSPRCRPDEPDGTLVDVLPIDYRGSGPVVRADQIDWTLDTLMEPKNEVYAVYGAWTTTFPPVGGTWRDRPPDEYVVVFSQDLAGGGVFGQSVVVAEGRVVRIKLGGGSPPSAVIAGVWPNAFVVPPPTPVPTPAGTPTPFVPYLERDPALGKAVGLFVLEENGEQRRIVELPATTLRWSLDGQRVYFVGAGSGYAGYGVYSVRPDGSELTKILAASGEGYEFSPDLSRVAYRKFEQPSGWTVRVADLADPASDRKLTDGFLESWSPDGKLIAYFFQVCEPPYAYWVTDLTGGQPRRVIVVTDNVLVSWFAWLPDGKRIAYRTLIRGEDGLEPGEVYAIDLETLAWSYLPELAFVSSRPLFSPDGQWFVYEGDEGIMLARWGEQSGKLIAGKGRTAEWDPHSDKIAIIGRNQVIFYHLADGQSQVVDLRSIEPFMGWFSLSASWSPDGNQLALTVSSAGGHGVCD